MLEIIKSENGEIKAICEYYIVDWQGHLDDKGTIIWIEEVAVSKSAENNGCLKHFIKTITDKVPYAEAGYFKRTKYNDRIKLYTRKQWLKLLRR